MLYWAYGMNVGHAIELYNVQEAMLYGVSTDYKY